MILESTVRSDIVGSDDELPAFARNPENPVQQDFRCQRLRDNDIRAGIACSAHIAVRMVAQRCDHADAPVWRSFFASCEAHEREAGIVFEQRIDNDEIERLLAKDAFGFLYLLTRMY